MLEEIKVVVYQNDYVEDHVEHTLVYEGMVEINEMATARDVFNNLNMDVPLMVHLCKKDMDEYCPVIRMSFYFDEDVLKNSFDSMDAIICELKKYGFDFDHLEFLVDNIGGIGAAGPLDFVYHFYVAVNEFVSKNPLAFEMFKLLIVLLIPKVKKGIHMMLERMENNLHYYPYFVQGLTFKNEYTLDSFTKSLHVETVVLLSYNKPDGYINVKVEFGEDEGKVPLDNIAQRVESYKPKERVTYKMI